MIHAGTNLVKIYCNYKACGALADPAAFDRGAVSQRCAAMSGVACAEEIS